MAARANYVKLGLFVVIGLAAVLVLGVGVGSLKLRRETIAYVTYFSEPVDGLEVGGPVKARGVRVGKVGDITFAPDHEMVEVRLDFDVASLNAMAGSLEPVRPDVRAQLASQGLVGARFISLDIFDPATHPAPPLGFVPPERYIPSTPSLQKNLEASAAKTLDRLSLLADSLVREGIVEKASHAVGDLDVVLADLDRLLRQVDVQKLPARTAKAIEDVRATVGKVNQALGGSEGNEGLLSAAQQALVSAGEVGRNASAGTRDLRGVLDEVRAAAAAIRDLAEQVDQNPDMLVKGRSNP